MRKIFLSYSALIALYNYGEISHADMAHGIFMFGCTPKALKNPLPKDPATRALWLAHGKQAHEAMMPHFNKAEKEGRVIWIRKPTGEYRVANNDFNKMLSRLGLPLADFGNRCFQMNQESIAELLDEMNVQLDPVYYRTVMK
jgi:hypothetical protein